MRHPTHLPLPTHSFLAALCMAFMLSITAGCGSRPISTSTSTSHPPLDQTPVRNEWYSLFNGRNLEGWTVGANSNSFTVRDGMIVVDGPRAHLFYTGRVSDADFRNFEFKAEVKTFPKANSGIYFHTEYQEDGWPQTGLECQVNATHGDSIKTGSIYGIDNLMDTAPHKDGEWFLYQIIVKGNTVTLKVDDRTVNEYTQPENYDGPRKIDRGTFALQAHDPESVIHYRNIMVKPLE